MKRIFKRDFDPSNIKIRKAKVLDIGQLVEVENSCFNYDQLGRRSFHWMIRHAHSLFYVVEHKKVLIGYGLVLINRGTSLARLYSICILDDFQGLGLASKLLDTLEEKSSSDEDCAFMRLEVKATNKEAISLYRKRGYFKYADKNHYYDDGTSAICFEKQIKTFKRSPRLKIPYHQQGTDFTCGPSCLLMAMKAFNPDIDLSLSHELDIWREATTIFMTSGHGGCGPQGLALAAHRRGFKSEVYLSQSDTMFIETVRSPEKKNIIELVQKDFEKKIKKTSIKMINKKLNLLDLKDVLKRGGIPIVLITTYHFSKTRTPHWVIVTGYEDGFIFIHDPDRESDHETVVSRVHIPIPEKKFKNICLWGKRKSSAVLVLYKN